MSHRAVVSARPWHGWESYAFLAVQLHYDIAQGLENLMPETQHLETSDCFKTQNISTGKAERHQNYILHWETSATTRRPLTCAVVSLAAASMHLCVRCETENAPA
jgi:hypothetical protein